MAQHCPLLPFFQARVAWRESYHRDHWEGGRCCISHDPALRGTASQGTVWLCEAGIVLQAVCQVMMFLEKTDDMLHRWFKRLNTSNHTLRLLCVEQFKVSGQRWRVVRAPPVNAGKTAAPLTGCIFSLTKLIMLLLTFSIWWLLQWCFTLWISVWAYKPGCYRSQYNGLTLLALSSG